MRIWQRIVPIRPCTRHIPCANSANEKACLPRLITAQTPRAPIVSFRIFLHVSTVVTFPCFQQRPFGSLHVADPQGLRPSHKANFPPGLDSFHATRSRMSFPGSSAQSLSRMTILSWPLFPLDAMQRYQRSESMEI